MSRPSIRRPVSSIALGDGFQSGRLRQSGPWRPIGRSPSDAPGVDEGSFENRPSPGSSRIDRPRAARWTWQIEEAHPSLVSGYRHEKAIGTTAALDLALWNRGLEHRKRHERCSGRGSEGHCRRLRRRFRVRRLLRKQGAHPKAAGRAIGGRSPARREARVLRDLERPRPAHRSAGRIVSETNGANGFWSWWPCRLRLLRVCTPGIIGPLQAADLESSAVFAGRP